MQKALLLCCLLISAFAVFEQSDVLLLTDEDYKLRTQDDKSYWLLLQFNNLDAGQAHVYENAAKALKGFVAVYALKTNDDQLKLSAISNGQDNEFSGSWDAKEIVVFAFDLLREYAFKRVGKVPKKQEKETLDESDVIVLNDADVDSTILNSKDAWFVEFYAPWCGHCKKLAPEWAKVATALKGEIKVAKVDASVEGAKSKEKYKVNGFPSIRFFGSGDKIDGDFENFDGARDYEALVQWARETNRKLKPLYFLQLKTQEQLETECLKSQGLCFILFVPDIYECNEECRERYLETYREVVKPLKSKPIVHFWSAAGDQYDFEEQFGITGAGYFFLSTNFFSQNRYPALLALSPKKGLSARQKGSFSSQNVNRFITNLLAGKEALQKLPAKLQAIQTIE